MFRWGLEELHHGCHEMALLEYFRSGLSAFRTTREFLRWRFSDGRGPKRLLDFGSGFGRLTRFLVRELPPERLWVAEVEDCAAAFQEERFGVHGLGSTTSPDAFRSSKDLPSVGFDAVLAYSVLTHLPRTTFERWLAVWLDLLAEDGILVVSVHDESVLLPGRTMPAEGIWFEAMSESESLELSDYGSTFVTEAFMAEALARVSGGRARYRRLPRGLWHFQDVYVVTLGALPELAELELVGEPLGALERCALDYDLANASVVLELSGWALQHGAKLSEVEVEIAVGGETVAELAPSEVRADAVAHLGVSDQLACGWSFRYTSPEDVFDPGALLTISARDPGSGIESVLHLGSIEAAPLYLGLREAAAKLDRYRHEKGVLAGQLEVIEQSGFGRLRQRWMEWKRHLGIT